MCVGNGANVVTLAIDTYYLFLPLELVLELNIFYYIYILCKNIILSSCLEKDGGYS